MNEEMPGHTADPPKDVASIVGMGETFYNLRFQEGDVFPVEPIIIL
jgi:hypothetical protein